MYTPKTVPFRHQAECFELHKDAQFLAILADMGTGKTKIAIDLVGYKYANGLTNRVLVVAPNDVHAQWADEQLPVHCGVSGSVFVYRAKTAKRHAEELNKFCISTSSELRILCVNFEIFYTSKGLELAQKFFRSSDLPPTIIIDEASRIKNPEAKSVQQLFRLRREFINGFRYIITGTPAAKSPVDTWSLFEFLYPGYMGCSYQAFRKEHQVLVTKRLTVKTRGTVRDVKVETGLDLLTWQKIQAYIKTVRQEDGVIPRMAIYNIAQRWGMSDSDAFYVARSERYAPFKNVDQLQKKIAPASFAVAKKDCLDLPEKVYELVKFTLSDEQKRIIQQMTKHSVSTYEGETITLSSKAQLGLRVLQVCGGFFPHHDDVLEGEYHTKPISGPNRKLQYILDDLPEIGEQQFIIWAVFTAEIQMLFEAVSKVTTCGQIGGGDSKDDRRELIRAFKAGEVQGLVCHPQAAGYGLNLQVAGVQYWFSRNYRTEARLQAEDRSHRAGISVSPVYKDLIYDIPFERAVLTSNKEGKDINDTFVTADLNKLFSTEPEHQEQTNE